MKVRKHYRFSIMANQTFSADSTAELHDETSLRCIDVHVWFRFLHSLKCRMNVWIVSVLILFMTYFHSRYGTSCEHLNRFSESQWHAMLGLWTLPFLIGTLCRYQHQPTFTDFTFDDMMRDTFHCYVALSRRLSSS